MLRSFHVSCPCCQAFSYVQLLPLPEFRYGCSHSVGYFLNSVNNECLVYFKNGRRWAVCSRDVRGESMDLIDDWIEDVDDCSQGILALEDLPF